MNNDIFEKWLQENENNLALTDRSYRKIDQQINHKPIADCEINTNLATYGDALLKLTLCEILWDSNQQNLTEVKQNYESDKVLVSVIAKHYDILQKLKYDENDNNKPKDYNYIKQDDNDKNPHKYIATAVEACLGAIWIKNKDTNQIRLIVEKWKALIDKENQPS